MYRYDENTPTVIFEGATKLPFSDDIDELLKALFYWLSCLTEIRRSISSGQWHVHLDDTDAIWDEEYGWQMPMD